MLKFISFLITVVGLPMLAQQIQTKSSLKPDKLALITFLNEHRVKIVKIAITGLVAMIFFITGIATTAVSFALQYDLNLSPVINATMITSLSFLLIGLVMGGIAWSMATHLSKLYIVEETVSEEPMSLGKILLNSVLNAMIKPKASKNYFATSNGHDEEYHRRNMLN